MRSTVFAIFVALVVIAGCASTPATPTPGSPSATAAPTAEVTPVPQATLAALATPPATAAPSPTQAPAQTATQTSKPSATQAPTAAAKSTSERDRMVSFVGAVSKLEVEYAALLEEMGEWQRTGQVQATDEQIAEKAQGFFAKRVDLAKRMSALAAPETQAGRLARDMFVNAYDAAVEAEESYLSFLESGDLDRLAAATTSIDNFTTGVVQARDALADIVAKYGISPQEAGVERFP